MQAQAAILAGGQGMRMRSVTHEPKALLPVGGRPLLAHQLEWLKKSGFHETFICLGYGADRVREVFGDGADRGMRLVYQVEASVRGTAGAARDLGAAGDLLVVYGDLLLDFDLGALMRNHVEAGAAATLVVRPTDHPEDSDLVDVAEDGAIRWIGRLGDAPAPLGERFGCAAVWVVTPGIFKYAPADAPSDFARDVFPQALAAGERLQAHRIAEGVLDIGTPERYARFCGDSA